MLDLLDCREDGREIASEYKKFCISQKKFNIHAHASNVGFIVDKKCLDVETVIEFSLIKDCIEEVSNERYKPERGTKSRRKS